MSKIKEFFDWMLREIHGNINCSDREKPAYRRPNGMKKFKKNKKR